MMTKKYDTPPDRNTINDDAAAAVSDTLFSDLNMMSGDELAYLFDVTSDEIGDPYKKLDASRSSTFGHQDRRQRHQQRSQHHHKKTKVFCAHCNAPYSNPSNAKRHFRNSHKEHLNSYSVLYSTAPYQTQHSAGTSSEEYPESGSNDPSSLDTSGSKLLGSLDDAECCPTSNSKEPFQQRCVNESPPVPINMVEAILEECEQVVFEVPLTMGEAQTPQQDAEMPPTPPQQLRPQQLRIGAPLYLSKTQNTFRAILETSKCSFKFNITPQLLVLQRDAAAGEDQILLNKLRMLNRTGAVKQEADMIGAECGRFSTKSVSSAMSYFSLARFDTQSYKYINSILTNYTKLLGYFCVCTSIENNEVFVDEGIFKTIYRLCHVPNNDNDLCWLTTNLPTNILSTSMIEFIIYRAIYSMCNVSAPEFIDNVASTPSCKERMYALLLKSLRLTTMFKRRLRCLILLLLRQITWQFKGKMSWTYAEVRQVLCRTPLSVFDFNMFVQLDTRGDGEYETDEE